MIAGLLGMNVALPFDVHGPTVFWAVLGLSVALKVSAVSYYFLRHCINKTEVSKPPRVLLEWSAPKIFFDYRKTFQGAAPPPVTRGGILRFDTKAIQV